MGTANSKVEQIEQLVILYHAGSWARFSGQHEISTKNIPGTKLGHCSHNKDNYNKHNCNHQDNQHLKIFFFFFLKNNEECLNEDVQTLFSIWEEAFQREVVWAINKAKTTAMAVALC